MQRIFLHVKLKERNACFKEDFLAYFESVRKANVSFPLGKKKNRIFVTQFIAAIANLTDYMELRNFSQRCAR